MTVSPLTFAEECSSPGSSPVILELSSWQLADIVPATKLRADTALITNIMADHQNAYTSMMDYVADKVRIFEGQDAESYSICPYDDAYRDELASHARGRKLFFSAKELPAGFEGAFLTKTDGRIRLNQGCEVILPGELVLQGEHNRSNLLAAGMIGYLAGIPSETIRERIGSFTGIEHRLELVAEIDGVKWYNDSAATIPEATAAALRSLSGRVHLIAGGTDKKLEFNAFGAAAGLPASIHLLSGTATDRMIEVLLRQRIPFRGPFDSLEEAVRSASGSAATGETVLFSPGSTSFGMFLNEFDRGRQFKDIVFRMRGRSV